MIPIEALKKWSTKQKQEFFQAVVRGRDDIVFFCDYFLGITLHDDQIKWLRNSIKPTNILTPGNKWGKTVAIAVKHIWKNFYKIGANGIPDEIERMEYQTLCMSPVLSQATRTKQYIEQILNSSFSWEDPATHQRKTNKCKIGWFFVSITGAPNEAVRFLNKCRVDIKSIGDDKGSKIQGSDWYYASYDEWTRSHHLEEELDGNIRPRLAVYGGDLDLVGTPDKDSPSLQYVYDICEDAMTDPERFYLQTGSMMVNKFISEKNKQKMVNNIKDNEVLKQVVDGQIIFTGGKMFSAHVVNNLWIPGQEWRREEDVDFSQYIPEAERVSDIQGWVWKLPEIREINGVKMKVGKYIISMDWHLSDTGDETVIYVIRYDIFPHELVFYLATKKGNPYVKHDKVRNLHKIYNNANLVVDSQGVGQQLKYDLEDLDPTCFDSVGVGKEKRTMLTILKNYLCFSEDGVQGKIKAPYIKELSRQLGVYREDDKRIKQDHVMTLGVACWWIENEGAVISSPPDARY